MAIYSKGEAVSRDGKPEIESAKVRKNVAAILIASIVILLMATAGFFYAVEKTTDYIVDQFHTDKQAVVNLQ